MSLPALNYAHHMSVGGGAAFVEHLQSFAVLCGWTVENRRNGLAWGLVGAGYYDWIAGVETYFQLRSSGYGAQRLGYEFRLVPHDASVDMIEWAMLDLDNDAVSYTSAAHPIEQQIGRNNYPASGSTAHWVNFPAATYLELWLFGDERFILAVNRVETGAFICFSFGTLVLAEECRARTDLSFWWPAQRNARGNEAIYRWDNIDAHLERWHAPFAYAPGAATDTTAYTADFYGALRAAAIASSSTKQQTTDLVPYHDGAAWQMHGQFVRCPYAAAYNAWSGKYPFHAPRHFVSTGDKFHAVGYAPIGWIRWAGGLRAGEELYYGAERFLAFPVHVEGASYGFVVRIE